MVLSNREWVAELSGDCWQSFCRHTDYFNLAVSAG